MGTITRVIVGIALIVFSESAFAQAPEGMIPYPVLKPAINARTQDFSGDNNAILQPSSSYSEPAADGNVIYPASKEPVPDPRARISCKPSPEVRPSFKMPKNIRESNNLWRRTGAIDHASGQYIRIDGTIRDQNCTPVSNAVVTLWQMDPSGMYESRYRRLVEDPRRHPDYDPNFGYSGRTTSNNLGEFSFLSVMPGVINLADPPHVNVKIEREGFDDVITRIYLLPNETPPDSSASPTRNPFRDSGIERLYDWRGITAGSTILMPEDKRYAIQFFADVNLTGVIEGKGLY